MIKKPSLSFFRAPQELGRNSALPCSSVERHRSRGAAARHRAVLQNTAVARIKQRAAVRCALAQGALIARAQKVPLSCRFIFCVIFCPNESFVFVFQTP
jgi:hypothetical protein